MFYQKPERYVWDFVEELLKDLNIQQEIFREMKTRGFSYIADFGVGKIVIEAEPPGQIDRGEEQLINYMNKYNFNVGILLDIPTSRYYSEYPSPYTGEVGFRIYVRTVTGIQLAYRRTFSRDKLEQAKEELRLWLNVLNSIEVAKRAPSVEWLLSKVQNLVKKYSEKLKSIVESGYYTRVQMYFEAWKKNMELIYGKETITNIEKNLSRLFAILTVYVTFLKVLGITLLESILGKGKYETPYMLVSNTQIAADKLWRREDYVGIVFERDEYDWVFDQSVSNQLTDFLRELGSVLLEFDWTSEIPVDMLKRIYQNIVPREIRRALGEYYTPDWLAKMILFRALYILVKGTSCPERLVKDVDNEIISLINEYYKKHGSIPRFVDPTCGSFTFGVQYLSSIIRWYDVFRPNIHPRNLAEAILNSAVGIDLNPVATITAKVNYLIQIHVLLVRWVGKEKHVYFEVPPTIPILRVDLTLLYEMSSRRKGSMGLLHFAEDGRYIIRIPLELFSSALRPEILKECDLQHVCAGQQCYVELAIPSTLLKADSLPKLHRALVTLISSASIEGLENELNIRLRDEEREVLKKLLSCIKCLEEKGFNSYILSIILNTLLLAYIRRAKFDLVLGNLPWVNISKFPPQYRDRLKTIMENLEICPPKEVARKTDISTVLFVLAAEELANERSGVIALMVPTSILRGRHGDAWRRYISRKLTLYEVWDLEEVKPFEQAENQPGIIFARKGE